MIPGNRLSFPSGWGGLERWVGPTGMTSRLTVSDRGCLNRAGEVIMRSDHHKATSTVEVLGTPLQVTDYEVFSDFCHRRVKEAGVFSVDFTNTQIVTMRRTQAAFRAETEGVDYFIPDGMPLVWCMNQGRAGLKDRVYGPTFFRHCLERTTGEFTHYFLGGSEGCLERLRERMKRLNHEIQICGYRNGYFSSEEESEIVNEINALSPDFIWVGLGTPKQQSFVHRWKSMIHRGGVFAVGYAFDVNAGTKPDPPLWMQRMGLGWAFRLFSEPRRLAGRYLKYNSLFLFFMLWDGVCGRAITSHLRSEPSKGPFHDPGGTSD